jgi:hypothetical protein
MVWMKPMPFKYDNDRFNSPSFANDEAFVAYIVKGRKKDIDEAGFL